MGAVTITQTTAPPEAPKPAPREFALMLAKQMNRAEAGLSSTWSQSPAERTERAMLEARAAMLRPALQPLQRGSGLTRFITRLLAGYVALRGITEEAAEDARDLYVEALRSLPFWAIDQAALNWSRGYGPNGRINPAFPPTPGELYGAAEALMAPYRRELHQIERVLGTEPEPSLDDAARARMLEHWQRLRPTLQPMPEAG